MKYITPTHYQPFETVNIEDVKIGMRLEIHMRTGKHAGREFYFDVKHIYTDSIHNTAGLLLYKRDLVKGMAEIRNRDAQPQPEEPAATFTAHYYTVTDDEIKPQGKVETYTATDRAQAIEKCLYTHRLHNGNATASAHGVIHCPKCGQIAIKNETSQPQPDDAQPYPMVQGEGAPQYTFDLPTGKDIQLALL